MRSAILFIASAGFTGYFPVAPGTAGTMLAIPLFWAFAPLERLSVALYLALFAVLLLAACWFAGKAEEILQEHDSPVIVIDEVVGYLAATLFLTPTWGNTLVAFLVFRLLDIAKPFPAGAIDKRVPGGYGVVLDDVVSGLYANAATRLLLSL